MEPSNVDQRLAEILAAPFTLPGHSAKPLSFRLLPEGGMVVISSDGRKLWFTRQEANVARAEMGLPQVRPDNLDMERERKHTPNMAAFRLGGGSRDGLSEMIVLPPDLKHLEKKINDKVRRP